MEQSASVPLRHHLHSSTKFDTIMSKREKLLWKFIHNPKNIQFHELETLLGQFGFYRIKTNAGSHLKWENAEKKLYYAAPRQNPVKKAYIKNLIDLLSKPFNLENT